MYFECIQSYVFFSPPKKKKFAVENNFSILRVRGKEEYVFREREKGSMNGKIKNFYQIFISLESLFSIIAYACNGFGLVRHEKPAVQRIWFFRDLYMYVKSMVIQMDLVQP